MKEIREYFNNLKQDKINIDKLIEKYQKGELSENEKNILFSLFDLLKSFVKSSDVDLKVVLKEFIDNKTVINIIDKIVMESLENYFNMSKLREIEKTNYLLAKEFIDELFNQYIVKYNPRFSDNYSTYNFESQKQMIKIIDAFNFLFTFYADMNFVLEYIYNDLLEELGLTPRLTDYCVKKYEQNCNSIRQNLFFDRIREIERILKE